MCVHLCVSVALVQCSHCSTVCATARHATRCHGEPGSNGFTVCTQRSTKLRALVSVTSGLWFDPGRSGVCIEVLL